MKLIIHFQTCPKKQTLLLQLKTAPDVTLYKNDSTVSITSNKSKKSKFLFWTNLCVNKLHIALLTKCNTAVYYKYQ